MQTYQLIPHPAFPPRKVQAIAARLVGRDENWLRLRWRIEGSAALVVPSFAGRGRGDELWTTTCFELFVAGEGEDYIEFNLSPSERWNAYAFSGRRADMQEHPMPREPDCTIRLGSSFAIFDAAIPGGSLPISESPVGISCVIEEEGGVKSYWALAHASDAPDFHDPACFTATLPAPTGA